MASKKRSALSLVMPANSLVVSSDGTQKEYTRQTKESQLTVLLIGLWLPHKTTVCMEQKNMYRWAMSFKQLPEKGSRQLPTRTGEK